MNWSDLTWATAGTTDLQFTTDGSCTNLTTYITLDPLRDWLPNSCLYEKYIPTWHLMESYRR